MRVSAIFDRRYWRYVQ